MELIAISQYCIIHNVDAEFISSLAEEGLIALDGEYIVPEQLPELEVYTRWHAEMGINTEGIDIIKYLLGKIRAMQSEMETLQSKLHIYE
jgi:hypothetical protein